MKKEPGKEEKNKLNSGTFIIVLALISILGFIGIISQTIFNISLVDYIESLWILIIGIGLLFETKFQKLSSIKYGLSSENFPHLTNFIIGCVAVFAGIFSFPVIRINNPSFHAIRGIVSIIAVIVIILETWIIKRRKAMQTS